ncbi:hypothetical protein [Sinorhizobium fredii]|uniref:hypothetical protein n=1 Tax=Rhizobium fredii TaxID=380 RepID=UPI00315AD465
MSNDEFGTDARRTIWPGRVADHVEAVRKDGTEGGKTPVRVAAVQAPAREVGHEQAPAVAGEAGKGGAGNMDRFEPVVRCSQRFRTSAARQQDDTGDQGEERTHRKPPFAAKRKSGS